MHRFQYYCLTSLSGVVFLVLGLLPAHAAPVLADYGALPAVSKVSISPNGEMVAFRRHTGERDIVVVVSLEDGEAVQGVDVSGIKLRRLYFFDNSKLILRASEHRRLLGYRGKLDVSTAFVFDLKDGKLNQLLTPGDRIYTGQSGLGRIVGVSEDRKYVYMPAFVPRSNTDRSPDYSLMRVELDSPRFPAVAGKGVNNTEDYFVDSGGNLVAEELFNSRSNTHSIVSYDRDGKATEIYREETEFPKIAPVGVTPDGSALVISSDDESIGREVLRAMALSDGKLSTPIVAREDADVEAVLTDINRVVHGVVYSGLRPSYEFFDPELTRRMEAIVEQYPGHSVWLADWSPDWKHLVVRVEGPKSSGDYLLYTEEGKRRFLASARPAVKPEHIHPVSEIAYKARDGLTIPALLTIPLSRAGSLENLPTVMLPHGGPKSHDWLGFDWLAQALAGRGYLVIQPQFRGSTGFGTAHWRAGRGEWGGKMQDDLTDGIDALVKEKLVDPERVCIMGMSYGGYAALAGGAFTPELYRCVVSVNGVSDLEQMLSEEKSAHGREHWIVAYWSDLMAKGEAGKELLQAVSPANHVEKFQAPVLLIHGKDDTVVPFEHARSMHKKLKRAGKEPELVALDDEDHYLSMVETRLKTLKAAVAFIDRHIGGGRDD